MNNELPNITVEDASVLLTTPNLRMTNRMRKALTALRESPVKYQWAKRNGATRQACTSPKQINTVKRLTRYTFKQLANLVRRIPVWDERTRRALVKTSKPEQREALKQKRAILRFMAESVENEYGARTGTTLHILAQ